MPSFPHLYIVADERRWGKGWDDSVKVGWGNDCSRGVYVGPKESKEDTSRISHGRYRSKAVPSPRARDIGFEAEWVNESMK